MKKYVLILTLLLSACSLLPQKNISGVYYGILPCADCEKIQAELVLRDNGTYQYNTIYFKNQKEYAFSESGQYRWDAKKVDIIRLVESDNLVVKIATDYIEFCDAEGNPVKSKHNYKLQKVKP